ncbi:MAG: ATP-binding protein [Caulobacteraceae bacterium]
MITEGELLAAALTGGVCLAAAAGLWTLAALRSPRVADAAETPRAAFAEAFDEAVIVIEGTDCFLASGPETMAACARALEAPAAPSAVLDRIAQEPAKARLIQALIERGESFDASMATGEGYIDIEGRSLGGEVLLRLSARTHALRDDGAAQQAAALLDHIEAPAWITDAKGEVAWANQAWLTLSGVESVEAAKAGAGFTADARELAASVIASGKPRTEVRWSPVNGARRAFRVHAEALPGGSGLAAMMAIDVTDAEEARETLKRHVAAHDDTLNRLADAVAIFTPERRLAFYNTAFATLWALEPAWLSEGPTHAEILDRLRQRRRLPETIDYAKWKAEELAYYEKPKATPDDSWSLPDGRTLRVARQPHPLGGLLLLFSDVTGELKLKAQFNSQIQVQQATLDRLSDAVAVFGSEGRLRLHNQAFEQFWNVTPTQLDAAGDFEGVTQLCLPTLHDLQFWRDLQARIGDPDPQARVPVSGEFKTSDRRVVEYRTRPLPDGATLLAFTDVTGARELVGALADREAALSEAERLKRDFVGNVSYELRTPLTTILGYSELLESSGEPLSDRARGHLASVKTAAGQLARSIDDVLDMAQIDAGEMALDLGDVDIQTLLEVAAASWAREAEAEGVSIAVDCDAQAGVIRGDEKRLGQTLDHLMANAIRQSPRGGVVTLNARRTMGEVQVQVSDTGRGIPFHVQAHIFDRFIGRDRGGPGLGLALVKSLVELHGGWVALESEPGHGATFTLHLPETAQTAVGQPELF